MKKITLVQGLGCTETGARIVLHELLKAAPSTRHYWVICTKETKKDFNDRSHGEYAANVRLFGMSHTVFGRWLRPFLELTIALACAGRLVERLINISHYGLCLGGRFVLYIHSPLLMDMGAGSGWGGGRSNILKRIMLNSCIKRADLLVLQTQDMRKQLLAYCSATRLQVPKHEVVRPKVSITRTEGRREFAFQLFYPTSRFAHKRAGLAIEAAVELHRCMPDAGLIITTTEEGDSRQGVRQIGYISREEVCKWYSGSDILLFTSERETLGLPLLEAMEFGLPVVAPRLPYAEELLGSAGCYFDEPTPEAVAAAVERCRGHYEEWRRKIMCRADEIRCDARTWSEHWNVFEGSLSR